MLSNAKLSKSFWAKGICTTVDLISLSPSASLDGNVPEEFGRGMMFLINT